jgi:hypothetical protein
MKLQVILVSIGALFIATVAHAQQPPSGSFQSYGNSGSSPDQPGYVRPMPNGGYIIQAPPSAPTYPNPVPNEEPGNTQNPSSMYSNSVGNGAAAPEAPSGPEKSGNR